MEDTITKEEAKDIRSKVADLTRNLGEMVKATKDKVVTGTADWTKEHPFAAIGVAAGLGASIGFALGLLVGRNRG